MDLQQLDIKTGMNEKKRCGKTTLLIRNLDPNRKIKLVSTKQTLIFYKRYMPEFIYDPFNEKS